MIRNAFTRLVRGREQTRGPAEGSAAQRTTVRSPPDRMEDGAPRAPASSSSAPPTQVAFVTPTHTRKPEAFLASRSDVCDEVIFDALSDRAQGPYPLMFRNVREALLADAWMSKEDGVAAKAVQFVLASLTHGSVAAILNEAKALGAHGVVKALEGVYAWTAAPIGQFRHGQLSQTRLRDAIGVPGGIVTISHNDPHPVRFWYPNDKGEWNSNGMRDAYESARPSDLRAPAGPWPYQPTAVAALPNGFAVFDSEGGIELFNAPSPNTAASRSTQIISATKTRNWTAATAVGGDRLVATTDEGTVHVFKLAGGQWKETKSMKTGHSLSNVVALGRSFAVSGRDNETITFFDERYKSKKLPCDRPVASLAALHDGKLVSVDSMGHTLVWSQSGNHWSKTFITYSGSPTIAMGNGFVMVDRMSVTTYCKVGQEWKAFPAPANFNRGVKSKIVGLCPTGNGIAVIFDSGPERMMEIKTERPWLLNQFSGPTSLLDALEEGNLALAQELLTKGAHPDEQLLTQAAIRGHSKLPEPMASIVNALLQLAYCEGVTVTDTRGHTLVGMALRVATSEQLPQVAQHIVMGATVLPVDVTKAIHMAGTVGMVPVLAALIQRRLLRVAQLPPRIGLDATSGYSLATAIADLRPVNAGEVVAAGLRYGFFPEIVHDDFASTKLAVGNMPDVVPKRSIVPLAETLVETLVFLGDTKRDSDKEGAVRESRMIISKCNLNFWSRGNWEDVPFIESVAQNLREAGMYGAILARYSAQRAPDGWNPPRS